jgi:hypothetical protein
MTYIPRSSIAGADTSAPSFPKLPRRANQGAPCFLDDLLSSHVYDAGGERWLPMEYIAFSYDTELDGGEVGDIELDVVIPEGMIILDGLIDVVDPFASAGAATIAISVEGANDILNAGDLATNGGAGLHDVVPAGSAATAVKTTEDRAVTVTIGTADLTGGKLFGYLRCFRGWPAEERSSSSSSSSSSVSSASESSSSSSSPSESSSSSSSTSSSSSSSTSSASSASSSSESSSSESSASESSASNV